MHLQKQDSSFQIQMHEPVFVWQPLKFDEYYYYYLKYKQMIITLSLYNYLYPTLRGLEEQLKHKLI